VVLSNYRATNVWTATSNFRPTTATSVICGIVRLISRYITVRSVGFAGLETLIRSTTVIREICAISTQTRVTGALRIFPKPFASSVMIRYSPLITTTKSWDVYISSISSAKKICSRTDIGAARLASNRWSIWQQWRSGWSWRELRWKFQVMSWWKRTSDVSNVTLWGKWLSTLLGWNVLIVVTITRES
jgi:hypothetical protein